MTQPPAPPPPVAATVPDVHAEIRKVSSLVATARRHLADGRLVDLSALEGKVRTLAKAIGERPPADSHGALAAVRAIIDSLDHLADELTAQFEAMAAEADGTARARASAAYRKASDDS